MAHPVLKPDPTLPDIQEYIAAMVKRRGFDKETVQDSFILLTEEVGELAKEIRKLHGVKMASDSAKLKLEHEVADVLMMLICVCNGLGLDLEQALRTKEEHNKTRTWS